MMGKSHSHTGHPSLKIMKEQFQIQADEPVNVKGNNGEQPWIGKSGALADGGTPLSTQLAENVW